MPSKSKKQHNFMEAIAHNPAFAKKVGVSQKVGQEYSKADKGKTFRKGGIMDKKDMHSEKSEMKMDKEQDKAMIKKAFKQHDLQEHKGGKGTSLKLKKGGMSAGCGYDAGGKVKKFAMGGYMGGATLPNQQFPMQQQAPQNTMLNAPQAPQAPGTPGMPYAANNQTAFKKGGAVKKMAMGGAPMMPPQAPVDPRMAMMAKKKAARGMAPARGMMPPKPPMSPEVAPTMPMKKGGKVKGQSPIQTKAKGSAKVVKMAKGGSTSSRDGCAIRGKTRA